MVVKSSVFFLCAILSACGGGDSQQVEDGWYKLEDHTETMMICRETCSLTVIVRFEDNWSQK